jgi:acetyl esterase
MTSLAPSPLSSDVLALPGQPAMRMRLHGRKRRGQVMPLVLHLHGGAFTSGDLDSGECLARLLEDAGAVVLCLAYPLAPANRFPVAAEAVHAALHWAHKQRGKLAGAGAPLFIAGEEAGGNLAAAVALMARDQAGPPLAGQILVTPMLDPCTGTASVREAMGEATCCKWIEGWRAYLRSPVDAEHPYAVPAHARRIAGLPPTLVLVGEDDPMRDEGLSYAQRLQDAGNHVTRGVIPRTGWPESLEQVAPDACPCASTVTAHLRAFLHAPTPPPS